ncbi:MAG: hypothetical protein DME88_14620 [Verrucomicrobia bacterium]|nr:MAG: hypothetical protein DME88_14620 [Verrucomicrobiota bacterium]
MIAAQSEPRVLCYTPSHSVILSEAKNPATSTKSAFNDDKSPVPFPGKTSCSESVEIAGCFASLNSPQDESAVADTRASLMRRLRRRILFLARMHILDFGFPILHYA